MSDEERSTIQQSSRQSLEAIFGADLSRLRELRARYAQVTLPVATHSAWGAKARSGTHLGIGWGGVDLRTFRGHNAYVWSYGCFWSQGRLDAMATQLKYYVFAAEAKNRDSTLLLQTLHEDGAFGCITFSYPGIGRVSRDLLESVIQINFLQKHIKVLERNDLRILDIGAGYGRMAHRMLEANSRIKRYTCVDAVPESTFLCEFYLKYRGLANRVQVVPMDELEQRLSSYDLALNIHSFSECTYAAIEWWLRKLKQLQVRYLMIVPNSPTRFLSTEVDGSQRDFAPLLEELGYALVAQEPLFDDQAVREYMRVADNMFLFDCRDCAS
jgi:SAM-dependent methyltransferase